MSNMIKVIQPNYLYHSFETKTKDGILSYIGNYAYTVIINDKGMIKGRVLGEAVYFYTAEKQRKKTIIVKTSAKESEKTGKKFKRKFIRNGHWKVRVYKFPKSRIVEGIQYSRTFKVVLK